MMEDDDEQEALNAWLRQRIEDLERENAMWEKILESIDHANTYTIAPTFFGESVVADDLIRESGCRPPVEEK